MKATKKYVFRRIKVKTIPAVKVYKETKIKTPNR